MKYLPILAILFFTSCVDYSKRELYLKKMYPQNQITPATSILKRDGYEFLMEDTINNQIFAVSFYPFHTDKISSIVNIK